LKLEKLRGLIKLWNLVA